MRALVALAAAWALVGCDSPPAADAGVDAGTVDDGGIDGGSMDAAMSDGGMSDAGASDGGTSDGGVTTIEGRPISPLFGEIVFNEVLSDGTSEGDPNGDGDANPVEDQFVELVNAGAGAVSMGGFTLVELDFPDLPRHTFRDDFMLEPGSAVVVFGGGDAPDATASATFFAANAADPGLPFGLALSVPSDSMLLLDDAGAVVARFCYGAEGDCALDAATDESLTRAPDLAGEFAPHRTATGSNGEAFSVGVRIDGSPF